MLRRRRKTPKHGRALAGAIDVKRAPRAEAPVSRRRARPDVSVPPELIVKREARTAPSRSAHGVEVVLVSGFEPFGGERTNPSWDICTQLPSEISGLRVETCRVPCEFRRSIEVVAEAIERHRPVLVVCLGQAGGRAHMSVERVGVNIDDARVADNAGAKPIDEPIAANGPPAYFATVPVKAMVAAMRVAGVPAEVSNSAGTYVCNHLMYGVLHYLAASGHRARAGFIHVPYSEEQALAKRDVPAMSIASMARGVHAAIAAAHENRHDLEVAEGALD